MKSSLVCLSFVFVSAQFANAATVKRTEAQIQMMDSFFEQYHEVQDAATAINIIRGTFVADPASFPQVVQDQVEKLKSNCVSMTKAQIEEFAKRSASAPQTVDVFSGDACPAKYSETYETRILSRSANSATVRVDMSTSYTLKSADDLSLFKVEAQETKGSMTMAVSPSGLRSNIVFSGVTKSVSFANLQTQSKMAMAINAKGGTISGETRYGFDSKKPSVLKFAVKIAMSGRSASVAGQKIWLNNLLLTPEEVANYRLDIRSALGAVKVEQ